ncbi:MAG TPA: hypothetical protein DEB09_05705 [Candidatus Magasanikbacteria bacterium]|nr:hypothetical protein [Candidatus Magasanikbacteria bacterium]
MDDSEIEQSQLVQPESEELSNGTKSESPLLRLKKIIASESKPFEAISVVIDLMETTSLELAEMPGADHDEFIKIVLLYAPYLYSSLENEYNNLPEEIKKTVFKRFVEKVPGSVMIYMWEKMPEAEKKALALHLWENLVEEGNDDEHLIREEFPDLFVDYQPTELDLNEYNRDREKIFNFSGDKMQEGYRFVATDQQKSEGEVGSAARSGLKNFLHQDWWSIEDFSYERIKSNSELLKDDDPEMAGIYKHSMLTLSHFLHENAIHGEESLEQQFARFSQEIKRQDEYMGKHFRVKLSEPEKKFLKGFDPENFKFALQAIANLEEHDVLVPDMADKMRAMVAFAEEYFFYNLSLKDKTDEGSQVLAAALGPVVDLVVKEKSQELNASYKKNITTELIPDLVKRFPSLKGLPLAERMAGVEVGFISTLRKNLSDWTHTLGAYSHLGRSISLPVFSELPAFVSTHESIHAFSHGQSDDLEMLPRDTENTMLNKVLVEGITQAMTVRLNPEYGKQVMYAEHMRVLRRLRAWDVDESWGIPKPANMPEEIPFDFFVDLMCADKKDLKEALQRDYRFSDIEVENFIKAGRKLAETISRND